MASSRRSAKPAEPRLPREPVDAILAALTGAAGASVDSRPVLVAFSGGLDSAVLLHAASRALGAARCVAVHVHHGLQAAADAWPAHCAEQATRLGVRSETLRLPVAPAGGENLEAWARTQRYRALVASAQRLGACAILTAHHADDQVETLLMRLARGTGASGLRGIHPQRVLDGVPVLRPLLALSREVLQHYAQAHALSWIEDPTNTDPSRLRNAFRHRVLPEIDAVAPAFRTHLLHAADLIAQAQAAADVLAQHDLGTASVMPDALPPGVPAGALRAQALSGLAEFRRHAALRRWIAGHGLPPPSTARLAEIDRQLLGGVAARGTVRHAGSALVRDRGWLFPVPESGPATPAPPIVVRWQGEGRLALPPYRGALCFDASSDEAGVSARWLMETSLHVLPGSASARLRPTAGARLRSLKNLYQESGVPAIARPGLPLVYAGEALLFAAGIGMDQDPHWPRDGRRVKLRWISAAV